MGGVWRYPASPLHWYCSYPGSTIVRVAITQHEGPTVMRSLPLAAGLLAAAVRADPVLRQTTKLTLHTARLPLEEGAAALRDHDVIGLSLCSWNLRYAVALAARLREAGGPLIVAGGPSVPRDLPGASRFLAEHQAFDVLVLGEGERAFVEILHAVRSGGDLQEVRGLALRGGDGSVVLTPARARLRDLADLPSPYLDGTFDERWAELGPAAQMAPIESNRGCPFSCSFCDWGQATQSAVVDLALDRVCAELDRVGELGIDLVYFVDANFGIRPRDAQIVEHLCEVRRRTGHPARCIFHLTKNATTRNLHTLERLRAAGIDCRMSLSMQDFDRRVLGAISRSNIPPARALALRALCHERGIPTFNELILGLPEQTLDSVCTSVVAATTPWPGDRFAIYLCRLLENTALASEQHRMAYGLKTVWCPTVSADPLVDLVVEEREEIVVGTATMTSEQWCRAYAFGHMVALCSQHGLMDDVYRALVFTHGLDAVGWFHQLLDALEDPRWPSLGRLGRVLERYTCSILGGGPMLLADPEQGGRRMSIEEALVLEASAGREQVLRELREVTLAFVGDGELAVAVDRQFAT